MFQNVVIMPTKTKPKIKVEEIPDVEPQKEEVTTKEEEVKVAPTETETTPEPEEKLQEETDTSIPKVSSFSYLDSNKKFEESETKEEEKPESVTEEVPSTEGVSEDRKSETIDEEKTEDYKKNMSSQDIKEWLKDVKPDTTKDIEKSNGPNVKVVILITVILFIIGAIIGGLIYYKNSMLTKGTEKTEEKQSTATSTPTPSPEIKVDLTKYTVSVLNGSGITGEAKKVKDILGAKGFTADNIKTGNAQSSDYISTSVSLKKDTPPVVFETIKNALEPTYTVVKSDKDLDNDSTYDIIIIVGKNK